MGHDTVVRVLLVDDDELTLRAWKRELRDRFVFLARTRSEAVAVAKEQHIDLAIVDLRLEGENGKDVLLDLKDIDRTTTVLMVSGKPTYSEAIACRRRGALELLAKPVRASRLVTAVETGADILTGDQEYESESRATLEDIEREHVDRTLAECGYDVTRAAAELGLHRTTLRRKLEKRGWTPPARRED